MCGILEACFACKLDHLVGREEADETGTTRLLSLRRHLGPAFWVAGVALRP